MLEPKQDKILKEFLNEVFLNEYGDGGDYGGYGGYGGGGGGGGHGVSDEFFTDIFNAFVDPLRHTAAFVERFSSEIQKLAGKLSEDVMALYIPGYKADYDEFEKEFDQRMNSIKDKYKEVFARTEAHLFTGDAALMAFLYAPHSYVTGRVLKAAPDTALSLIDMFAGGNQKVKNLTDKAREVTGRIGHVGRMRGGPTSPKPLPVDVGAKKPITQPKIKQHRWWNPKKDPKGQDYSKRFYGKTHYESISREEEIIQEGIKDFLGKIVDAFKKSPEIEKAIEQSQLAQSMRKDAEELAKDYVREVVDLTKEHIQSLKSTSALDKATKGKFSELIQQKGQGDAKKTAQLVVGSTKKGIKDMAIENLKEKMSKMPSGLQKIYQVGISKIQSM